MGRWLAAVVLIGCDASAPSTGPTWHGDVAPVIAERCGDCHYDGGPGAYFDARDYDQTKEWEGAILAEIAAGRMPPFAARRTDECDSELWFKDDGQLLADERELIETWYADGAPEGKANDAIAVPPRTVQDLQNPDAVLGFRQPFTIEPSQDDIYRCFRIQIPEGPNRWITGMQVIPGNDRVVHHALVWSDPEDQSLARGGADGNYNCSGEPDVWPTELIGTWTPGGSPMITPEGTGVTLRSGSSIVVNIHYHPTVDSTEIDNTEIALTWTEERPEKFATWYLVDLPFGATAATGPFEIPPNVADHVEEVLLTNPLPFDVPIFAIAPHMHYLGRGMKVTLETNSEDTCLVHTPTYAFDFQQSYIYDAPVSQLPTLGFGDRIRVRCTYDNSPSNPYFNDALEAAGLQSATTVGWGEWTEDEMCMAMVGLVSPVEVIDVLSAF